MPFLTAGSLWGLAHASSCFAGRLAGSAPVGPLVSLTPATQFCLLCRPCFPLPVAMALELACTVCSSGLASQENGLGLPCLISAMLGGRLVWGELGSVRAFWVLSLPQMFAAGPSQRPARRFQLPPFPDHVRPAEGWHLHVPERAPVGHGRRIYDHGPLASLTTLGKNMYN